MFLSILILNVDKLACCMKIIQKIIEFYVFSNLHVSLSVSCLVLVTGILFDETVVLEAVFMGLLTFVAYHLIRHVNRFKYGKEHLLESFSRQHKQTLSVLVVLATIFSFFLVPKFTFLQLLCLLPFGICTLLYAFGVFKVKGQKYSIRYLPGIKIFIIAAVWAGAVVLFPLQTTKTTLLYFLEVLLFVVALTLPFDIRDLRFDHQKIKTIPMVLGLRNTKIVGGVLLIISSGIHLAIFNAFPVFVFICLLVALCLFFSTTKQSKYYASFWVESLPILYYLLLLVCNL